MYRKNRDQQSAKENKSKMKTLPNEPATLETNQHFFQSVSQNHQSHLPSIDLASPTFATECQATSITNFLKQNNSDFNYETKQNCLREITTKSYNKTNQPQSNLLKSSQQTNKVNRKLFIEPSADNQEHYKRLLQKCCEIEQENMYLKEQNKINTNKLKACQKTLQSKLEQALKWKQASNSSPQFSNIDCFLEVKSFRDDFKKMVKKTNQLESKDKDAQKHIKQLEDTIMNFTSKEEQQTKKQKQNTEKIIKKYKGQQEELKKEYEGRILDYQKKYQELEKGYKKARDDSEKAKFLKEQIEKKRQEQLQAREEIFKKLSHAEHKCQELQTKNSQLKQEVNSIYQQYEQQKASLKQQDNQQKCSLKLELAKLKGEYEQLHKLYRNLEKQNKELYEENKNRQSQAIEEIREENHKLVSENQKLISEHQKLLSENRQLRTNQTNLNERIEGLQKQIDNTLEQYQDIKIKFEDFMQTSHQKLQEQRSKHLKEHSEKLANLNLMIQELQSQNSKISEELQTDRNLLSKYKEDYEKASSQLESTYRKMEQIEEQYSQKNKRSSNPYDITMSKPMGLSTKAISQLEMIKNILSVVLNIKQNSQLYERQQSAEQVISELVYLAEQCADFYDQLVYSSHKDKQAIKTKQEIISKILKFAPEEDKKKRKILQYLRIMDNLEDFTIDEVNRVNIELREEWEEWSMRLKGWKKSMDQLQEQNSHMRKLLRGASQPRRNNYYDEVTSEKWQQRNKRFIMQ